MSSVGFTPSTETITSPFSIPAFEAAELSLTEATSVLSLIVIPSLMMAVKMKMEKMKIQMICLQKKEEKNF